MRALGSRRPAALATYSLLLVEQGAMLGLPALLGVTIDALMQERRGALVWLAGGVMVLLIVGALRRFVDTRVFGAAERDLGMHHGATEGPIGRRVGRLRQINELMQFFERHLPEALTAAVGGLGSLIVLWIYNWRVGAAAGVTAVALLILNGVYASRVQRLNGTINNAIERDVEVLEGNDRVALWDHLEGLRRTRVQRSDAEILMYALNWTAMLGLILATLFWVTQGSTTTGGVFAVMTYLFQFAESWNNWPSLTERWTQYRDVQSRLSQVAPSAG